MNSLGDKPKVGWDLRSWYFELRSRYFNKNNKQILEAVDLCGSIFVLFEHAFIAALNMWPSNLSEY
ncbi:hypothetical protein [Pseudoalteromonas sp. MMG012]|uniref:hypothetical protein n=1 Tax=Pseudoalteromonas sp. MMG012 TaxID=2822686 RepID=UPI001B39E07D|nr:hypothetical protein [Pseudoalteromonas sp. MMG012]MBQ4849931.1 hypothetical protein [Pseudoalteromonas sp. MMG012]